MSKLLGRLACLSMVLVSVPTTAVAGPAEGGSEVADPAVTRARELFNRGQGLYQTADYQGAVEAFTQAFMEAQNISDEELHYAVHTALLFNLARAHVKAYKTDLEAAHLRKAQDLLDSYLELELGDEDRKEAEEFRSEAVDTLARLEAEAEAERAAQARVQQSDTQDEDATTQDDPRPVAEPATTDAPPEGDGGRAISIAGYASLGVGAVGLGLMGGGMAMANGAQKDYENGPDETTRSDAESRGALGNTLTYAGAAVGAVGLITGVALIAVGAKRKKAGRSAARPSVAPAFGTHQAGVVVTGRF